MLRKAWLLPLGFALSLAPSLAAQSGVKVEVDDITDNRIAAEMMQGQLQLRLKLTGTNLDKATAARIVVKEAKDDRGTVLVKPDAKPPDFEGRDYNSGMIMLSIGSPARSASRVKMKGSVDLFVPSRDPGATVKIANALKKLDAPYTSPALKAAKIELTPLSAARYKSMQDERKLTDDKIAQIRAEGKKAGASEKDIELAIGLAKAFESMDAEPRENAIYLSGKEDDFDRIYRIEVLGADGKPIDVPERGTSTRGDDSIMTLIPKEAPPAGATLQVMLLTDKSKMSFPFELSIDLP